MKINKKVKIMILIILAFIIFSLFFVFFNNNNNNKDYKWIRVNVKGDGRCSMWAVCKLLNNINDIKQLPILYKQFIDDKEYFVKYFYNDKANIGELIDGKYIRHSNKKIKQRLERNYDSFRNLGKKYIQQMEELIKDGDWSNEISDTNHYNDFIKWWYSLYTQKNIEVVSFKYNGSKTEFNNDDILNIFQLSNNNIEKYEKHIKDKSLLIMITNGTHYNVIYNKEFVKNNLSRFAEAEN